MRAAAHVGGEQQPKKNWKICSKPKNEPNMNLGGGGRHLLLLLALLDVLSVKVGIGHGHDHQGKTLEKWDFFKPFLIKKSIFQLSFNQIRIYGIWWMTELTQGPMSRSVLNNWLFLVDFMYFARGESFLRRTCGSNLGSLFVNDFLEASFWDFKGYVEWGR